MCCGGSRSIARGRLHSASCFPCFWRLLTWDYSAVEYTYLLFWNSIFTVLPVVAIGLFDRIVGAYIPLLNVALRQLTGSLRIDDRVLMALPELYRFGRESKWFSMRLFNIYMADGVIQASSVLYSAQGKLTCCIRSLLLYSSC